MRRVLSQGEYDGACFLYSAANAYRTLTRRKPTQRRWNEALKWIPFASDFITDNGTLRYDDNMALYKFALERIFREFGGTKVSFKITPYPNLTSPSKLIDLIKKDSVVVLNVDSEHWIVCVEVNQNNVLVACSDQLRIMRAKYAEYVSDSFRRYYNLVMEIGQRNWVYNPSVLQIKKIE